MRLYHLSGKSGSHINIMSYSYIIWWLGANGPTHHDLIQMSLFIKKQWMELIFSIYLESLRLLFISVLNI